MTAIAPATDAQVKVPQPAEVLQPETARTAGVVVRPWTPPLAVVLIAVVVALLWGVPNGLQALLAGIGALLALIGISRSISSGLRPVGAAFHIFWFAWLGVAPIVQLTLHLVAWGDTTALDDPGRVVQALVMNDLALGAFLLGQVIASARGERLRAARSTPSRASVRGWVLAVLLLGLVVVAPHAIATNGGIGTFFSSRHERGQTLAEAGANLSNVGGLEYALVTALPVGLAVSATILALMRIQLSWHGLLRMHVLDVLALTIGLAGVVVFANPLSNTRFIGVSGLGALAILLARPRSRRAGLVFAGVGLVATLVLYPLANLFRGTTTAAPRIDAATFASADFDGFQQVINTITYVQDLGITWGIHLASAAAYFVPRSIWHAKAIPASLDVAAHANYTFINLSLPVHAEFYLEFSWPGLVLGMLALGLVAAAVDSAWLRRPGTKLALFAPYLTVAVLGLIRGPFGSQVPVYLTVLAFLFLGLRRNSAPQRIDSDPFEGNSQSKQSLVRQDSWRYGDAAGRYSSMPAISSNSRRTSRGYP